MNQNMQWILKTKADRAIQRKSMTKALIAAGHSRSVALKKAKVMVK